MTPRELAVTPESFATFGELLRYLRQRAQVSRAELARASGYSESLIARLELNQRRPNPITVQARFVPALDLEAEPAWVKRLIALAVHPTPTPALARASDVRHQAPDSHDTRVRFGRFDSVGLLATKLFAPRPQPNSVPRQRLLAQLDRALGVPLTLIAAPAGAGKTTLLADWLGQAESSNEHADQFKYAWLSLDSSDNNLTTFVGYLVAACRQLAPEIGQTTSALLQQPASRAAELLTPLVNELVASYAAAPPRESVLVLDDVHLLTDPAVHDALAFMTARLPPHMHLILVGRDDPPLPLSQLRARGHLVEVRAHDLRFTTKESAALLGAASGTVVTDEQAAALEARTEGWAAGLHLAALALRDRPHQASGVGEVSGSSRHLIEYMADEVLGHLPAHLRTFVLQTAILERMCGELCDAVLGVTDGEGPPTTQPRHSQPAVDSYSQLMLDELERRQLFIVALDDERRWYRYHQVFAELLRQRLMSGATAEHVAALHQRASTWFERRGLIEQAIEHALATAQPETAARLVEQRAEALLIGSEMMTLRCWIERLPEQMIRSRRRLALTYAGVLLSNGNVAAVEPLLQAAERARPPASDDPLFDKTEAVPAAVDRGWTDELAGYTATLRSIVARTDGDFARAIALGQAALDHLPDHFVFMRSATIWNLGTAYWLAGDLAAADEVFSDVWARNQDAENMYALAAVTTSLGQVRVIRGRLHEAAHLYRYVLEHAARLRVRLPSLGMMYVGLGGVLREWNDLHGATQHLNEGIALGKLFGSADVLSAAYTTLARVEQAQGDLRAAADTLAQAGQFTPGFVFSLDRSQPMRALLAQGETAAVAAWATRSGAGIDTPVRYEHEAEHIMLSHVLLGRAAYREALSLLERLVTASDAGGRSGTLIEALALQALAYHGLDDRRRALTALERALTLAEPEGYVRSFVDRGAPMAMLLREAKNRGITTDYVAGLLAAFSPAAGRESRAEAPAPVHSVDSMQSPAQSEQLNEREQQVLRLIAAGHSNREIADILVIALSTVKTHINNLYAKLGIHSRTRALARARELGLL